jgi:hypothetical protein
MHADLTCGSRVFEGGVASQMFLSFFAARDWIKNGLWRVVRPVIVKN